jgi:hypothetical protein
MNVRSLPDSSALLRRSNQWKPIPNFARWPGVSKTAKLLAQFPMQPEERWYQGKASPFSFARSSSKSSHVRFVAGDPSVNCSLGNVSHGHRDGRLQEKTSLAFFNKNHGVAKLIETQFATEGRGQCKRATFAQRNGGCHAAMLHRSNAILKCKLRNSALVCRRRCCDAGLPASTVFSAAFIAASWLNRPTLPTESSISVKRGTKVAHAVFRGTRFSRNRVLFSQRRI